MKREFAPARLDVPGFAEAGAALSAQPALAQFARLAAETAEPGADQVSWTAAGQERTGPDGQPQPWMHLTAETTLTLVCQRCLAPVRVPLQVDRWFRFVADEDTAAALDEEAEEDVLVSSQAFDLPGLIEDELLMELPITPRHEVCPDEVPLSAVDPEFERADQERPNPFAALAKLRTGKPE